MAPLLRTRSKASQQHASTQVQEHPPTTAKPKQLPITTQEAATTEEQAVTTQQSLEVVQTFIYGAVSAVLWLRSPISDRYFKTLYNGSHNKNMSYEEFVASDDTDTRGTARARPTGFGLQVMKKGVSRRLNGIIHSLETGTFDAVQQGYLKALQLSFFQNPENPSQVLELYTFRFQYTDDAQASDVPLVDVSMTSLKGPRVTLKDARAALNQVVKLLITKVGQMPTLPMECTLGLHLLLNDRAPKDYRPSGFVQITEDSLRFPAGAWVMETAALGKVETGIHAVGWQVSHVSQPSFEGEAHKLVILPDEFGSPISRQELLAVDTITQTDEGAWEQESKGPATASAGDRDQAQTSSSTSSMHKAVNAASTTTSIAEMDLDAPYLATQDTGIAAERDSIERSDLIRMLQPSLQDQNAQDTQQLSYSPDLVQPVAFSQRTIARLNKTRSNQLPPRTKSLIRTSDSLREIVDIVDCECGNNHGDEMIQCGYCNKWQHVCCYGYQGANDKRIPDDHACYHCLLHGEGQEKILQMACLAQMRRVIHALEQRVFDSSAQLADTLGFARSNVSTLLNTLRKDHMLASPKGPKKNTLPKKIMLDRSSDVAERIVKKYYDPTVDIGHHLEHPTRQSAQERLDEGKVSLSSNSRKRTVLDPPVETPTAKRSRLFTTSRFFDMSFEVTPTCDRGHDVGY